MLRRSSLQLLSGLISLSLLACAATSDSGTDDSDLHRSKASDFTIGFSAKSLDTSTGFATATIVTAQVNPKAAPATILLEVTDLPSGVTATITPSSVTAGQSAQLVLSGIPQSLITGVPGAAVTVEGYSTTYLHQADLPLTLATEPAVILDQWSVDLSNGGASVHYTCNASLLGTLNMQMKLVGCPAGVSCQFGEGSIESGYCNLDGGRFTLSGWPSGALPPSMSLVSAPYAAGNLAPQYTTSFGLTEVNRPVDDFILTLSAPSVDLSTGSASLTISTAAYDASKPPAAITLSMAALPTGVSGQLSTTSLTAGQSAVLTLTGVPFGAIDTTFFANILLTAWAKTESRTTNFFITLHNPPAVTFSEPYAQLPITRYPQYTCNAALLGETGAIFNVTSCPAGMSCSIGYVGMLPCDYQGQGELILTGTPTEPNPVVVMTAFGSAYQGFTQHYTVTFPIKD